MNSDVSLYCLDLETFVGTKYGFWVGENPGVGPFSHSKALVLRGSDSSPRRATECSDCRVSEPLEDLVQPLWASLDPRERSIVPRGT